MKNFLEDLIGKAVLVTGSSTGIGAAVAIAFGQAGAKVAVHCNKSRAEGEKVVAAITEAGGTAVLLSGDVCRSAEAKRLVDETVATFGRIDVLVNNAGGLVKRTPPEDNDDAFVDAVMDLNIRSVVAASRAAIPYFAQQKSGNIITTGSVAGRNGGGPGASIYASTKGFVHTFTKSLAKELVGHNVRVNAVAPGVIETPFHASTTDAMKEAFKKGIPMGRLGTAEDLVGAYLFLASDTLAGYVTGQILDVNGGQLMP